MRVLIVDDEPPARERLRSLVESMDDHEVVGETGSGRGALDLSQRYGADIVLLDIRMPEMDGLEAARHLSALQRPPAVIFVTAYSDHALEAFSAHAVDYLLKPVRLERLRDALGAARTMTRAQAQALHSEGAEEPRSHLMARRRGRVELIPIEDVYYLQADHKYVTVRYSAGERLIEESLKALEQEFGERFIRIHRNALVSAQALIGIERGTGTRPCAVLRDLDERLEISRRHLPAVRQRLESRVSGNGGREPHRTPYPSS